ACTRVGGRSDSKGGWRMADWLLMKSSLMVLMYVWNRWTMTSGGWEFNQVERTSIFGSLWKMGVYGFAFLIRMTKTQSGKAITGRDRRRERIRLELLAF